MRIKSKESKPKNPNSCIRKFVEKYHNDFIKEYKLRKKYDTLSTSEKERIQEEKEKCIEAILIELVLLIGISDTIMEKEKYGFGSS